MSKTYLGLTLSTKSIIVCFEAKVNELKAKSQIFTKESLTKNTRRMRNWCIKSFNKVYEKDYQLKQKQQGRNQDISVSKMLKIIIKI